MKQQLISILILLACTLGAAAQPKWVKKARKAQINLITYDANGQLLHSTNGFFIDADGTALTDYRSFRGASRAVAIDENGKEWPVVSISGASSLYDVLKIKIAISKPYALTPASVDAMKDEHVFVMPYLSNKSGQATETAVTDVSTFNEQYAYYTLPVGMTDKSMSCPVMNAKGEVLGLVQLAAAEKDKDKSCYVLSVRYAQALATSALSATAADYRDILIRKTLPADASQANSFIYLTGARDSALYLSYIEEYITRFPQEANGYNLKAELLTGQERYAEAEATWDAGLEAKAKEDEIRYSRAQAIFHMAQTSQTLPDTWNLERAMQETEAALAVQPLPVYASLRAKLFYGQKRYAEACQEFLALNNTNLRSADNFLYAAQCQQMLRDTIAVLALQDSAVACFTPPYVEAAAPALLMRATTLISMGSYRDAVRDLNDYEHLKANELTANFYYQREQAEMRCRMFQQALNDIERATKMAPQEPLFQAELAAVNYRLGQVDEAISAARAAIALDDQFADAYRILGVCLRAQKKESEARAALQHAADLGDEISQSLLNP